MLDIKAIRQNPDAVVAGLNKRGHTFPLGAQGRFQENRRAGRAGYRCRGREEPGQ